MYLKTFRKSLMPPPSVPTVTENCYLNQIHLNAVLTVIFNVLIILQKIKGSTVFHIQNVLTGSVT